MKVKELIKKLECYNPDAEVSFTLNPVLKVIGVDKNFDVELLPDLIGDVDSPRFLCRVHKSKLNNLSEIIPLTKDKLTIDISNDGIFVNRDGELEREIELLDNYSVKDTEEFIKMLIRIL